MVSINAASAYYAKQKTITLSSLKASNATASFSIPGQGPASAGASAGQTPKVNTVLASQQLGDLKKSFNDLMRSLSAQGLTNSFVQQAYTGGDSAGPVVSQDGNSAVIKGVDPKQQAFNNVLGQFRNQYNQFSRIAPAQNGALSNSLTGLTSQVQALKQAASQLSSDPQIASQFQAVLNKIETLNSTLSV